MCNSCLSAASSGQVGAQSTRSVPSTRLLLKVQELKLHYYNKETLVFAIFRIKV